MHADDESNANQVTTNTPRDFSWLVGNLVSESSEAREDAAANAAFWASHLPDHQKKLLTRLLSGLVPIETSPATRESQLNALLELFSPPVTTRDDIAPVLEMARPDLTPGEQSYIDDMVEELRGMGL